MFLRELAAFNSNTNMAHSLSRGRKSKANITQNFAEYFQSTHRV